MTLEERKESAHLIRSFLDGTCGPYDWDDFISPARKDREFEELRVFCAATDQLYPPADRGHWCGDAGVEKLKRLSDLLIYPIPFDAVSDFIRSEFQTAGPVTQEKPT